MVSTCTSAGLGGAVSCSNKSAAADAKPVVSVVARSLCSQDRWRRTWAAVAPEGRPRDTAVDPADAVAPPVAATLPTARTAPGGGELAGGTSTAALPIQIPLLILDRSAGAPSSALPHRSTGPRGRVSRRSPAEIAAWSKRAALKRLRYRHRHLQPSSCCDRTHERKRNLSSGAGGRMSGVHALLASSRDELQLPE